MPKLEITKEMLQEAIIAYASHKLGVPFPLEHSIKMHGSWMVMGGDCDALMTVELNHLPNVVPLPRKGLPDG